MKNKSFLKLFYLLLSTIITHAQHHTGSSSLIPGKKVVIHRIDGKPPIILAPSQHHTDTDIDLEKLIHDTERLLQIFKGIKKTE